MKRKGIWKLVLGIILALVGLSEIGNNAVGGLLFAAIGVLLIWLYLKKKPASSSSSTTNTAEKPAANRQSRSSLPPLPTVNTKFAPVPKVDLSELKQFPVRTDGQKRKRRTGFPEIKYSNITKSLNTNNFVVIDTETTGTSPYNDRIIELSAVRFKKHEPVEYFQTLIDPERKIPSSATNVNHITDAMVEEAPKIWEVLDSFEEFVGNSPVVGHNLGFDLRCLYYSGSKLVDDPKRKYIDTLAQSRRFLQTPKRFLDNGHYVYDYSSNYDVENRKLQTLLQYFQIDPGDAHRSTDDALATGFLMMKFDEIAKNR